MFSKSMNYDMIKEIFSKEGRALESNRLPDTPWHIGYTKKEENDPRRHKSRCIYKQDGICHQGKSGAYTLKCPGSSHCLFYAESEKMAEEVYLKTRSAEEEYADNMKDVLFAGKAKINEGTPDKTFSYKQEKKCVKFSGTDTIRIQQIKLPQEYNKWKPNQEEVDRLLIYYEEHHKMDKPIVVEIRDDKYYLKDNYLQYYVSKKLKKTWIKATMNIKPFRKKTTIKKKY